ncbi:hypothetical protein [Bradyrhizobium phage BDU-MI-1]|nr:hypothetical protein [Bradyrhizobium phage BDU-MI-1]
MAKRFIERPTARQIMTKADRDAAYERSLESNRDWLAANFAHQPLPEAPRVPKQVDSFHASIMENDRWLTEMENWNETPDPLGKTGSYEPKSIHDPVKPARISFEKPRKRQPRDPYATNNKSCELPDHRRNRHYTIENADGSTAGVIAIHGRAQRIRIEGFGLQNRRSGR